MNCWQNWTSVERQSRNTIHKHKYGHTSRVCGGCVRFLFAAVMRVFGLALIPSRISHPIGGSAGLCNMYGFYAACSSICAMKRFQGLMASARMAAPTSARQNQRKMVVPQPSHSATKPNR